MVSNNIIRVFPRRTKFTPKDDYAFVGDPPMIRPEAEQVHISVSFTWDMEESFRLYKAWSQYYETVLVGDPVFGDSNGFEQGLYIKPGIIFTSRGCNNKCSYCLVPQREGILKEINNFHIGNIIQDNNILQCNKKHISRVFEMLKTQSEIQLSGGLDSCLITDDIADQLRDLRIRQLFLACDYPEALKPLRKAIKKLSGFRRDQLRCYVLIGLNNSISEAINRLQNVWAIGCMPFTQLYQPPDKYIKYSKE